MQQAGGEECNVPEYQGGELFLIEIRALRSDVPPHVRLRRLLKSLLRTYQFRAVRVQETTPASPAVQQSSAPHADGGAAAGDR
jgi:hypothetical protein